MSSLLDPPWPTRPEHVPMPLDDYLALREHPKAEYVDGVAIVSPPATHGHNKVQRRLANLLEGSLAAELDVVTDAGWSFGGRRRVPDVAVFASKSPEAVFVDDVPVLVAEVLSPSTWSEDTVRKSVEYLEAGVGQYWTVDRANRVLNVFANSGDGWDVVLRLDDARPAGEVAVEEYGEVALDLEALLRP